MSELLLKWVGGGILVVTAYVIISNTLWLLLGSRLLQALPGVNVKGASGTLKIAILLVMSLTGALVWLLRFPLVWVGIVSKKTLTETMSYFIQMASTSHERIMKNHRK